MSKGKRIFALLAVIVVSTIFSAVLFQKSIAVSNIQSPQISTYTIGQPIYNTPDQRFFFHGFTGDAIVIGHLLLHADRGGMTNMFIVLAKTGKYENQFTIADRTYLVIDYNEYEGWISLERIL